MASQAERYLNNAITLRKFADGCEDRQAAARFIEDAMRYEKLALVEFEAEALKSKQE